MRIYKVPWIVLGLLISLNLNAQDFHSYVDSIYGLNPSIYNGHHNPNNVPGNIIGNPFFKEKEYKLGTITVDNKTFNELYLNYDIYNQDILLKYLDKYNSKGVLRISNLNISEFSIQNKKFEMFGDKNDIYQYIGNDSIKIYYKWTKTIEFKANNSYSNYRFSKTSRKMFVLNDNKLLSYKSNRSFIKCFNTSHKTEIKKYLKTNKINVKKAGDATMLNVITFCNTL